MADSRYKGQPDLEEQVRRAIKQIRDLAIQTRSRLTTLFITAETRLTVNGSTVRVMTDVAINQDGSILIDATSISHARMLLTLNSVITTIENAIQGQEITLTWVQDSTGGRTYAWPTNSKFAGTAPNNATANTRTSVTFVYDSGTWYELYRAVGVG